MEFECSLFYIKVTCIILLRVFCRLMHRLMLHLRTPEVRICVISLCFLLAACLCLVILQLQVPSLFWNLALSRSTLVKQLNTKARHVWTRASCERATTPNSLASWVFKRATTDGAANCFFGNRCNNVDIALELRSRASTASNAFGELNKFWQKTEVFLAIARLQSCMFTRLRCARVCVIYKERTPPITCYSNYHSAILFGFCFQFLTCLRRDPE